jgi:rubrerythrin
LQKLQQTEYDGFIGNQEAEEKWNKGNNQIATNIFKATGWDELRHSDMLVELLHKRGYSTKAKQPESLYWLEMDKVVTDLETSAAVLHLGERLAAERFQVIFEQDNTPDDIRAFIASALPDEEHHARIFGKLSSPEAIQRIESHHCKVVATLKGQK